MAERRRHKPTGKIDPSLERRETPTDRRRRDKTAGSKPKAGGTVTFDDKGNAVWAWRIETPHRRDDDPTIDFLECLDIDELEIEDDGESSDETVNKFNPYSRG